MKLIDIILRVLFFAGLLLALMFVNYGIETDCPDTAGYVYCPKSMR